MDLAGTWSRRLDHSDRHQVRDEITRIQSVLKNVDESIQASVSDDRCIRATRKDVPFLPREIGPYRSFDQQSLDLS